MDVAAILSELDDHGFEDLSTARKTAMINDTYYEVCTLEAWPFLEASTTITTTADTSLVTTNVPADLSKVLTIRDDDNDYVLVPERLDSMKKSYDSEEQGEHPVFYYFIGDALHVWPVPTSAVNLSLFYIKTPNTLTGAGTPADDYTGSSAESAILVPVRHHRLLVLGSLVKLYSMEDDPELAGIFDAQFDRKLERMRNDVWMRQFDRPDRIHVLDDDELFGFGGY